MKGTVALIVRAGLINLDLLTIGKSAAVDCDGSDQTAVNVLSLSFEQQTDLMLLEIEKVKLNREIEIRSLEVEAMRFQLIGGGKLGDSCVDPNVIKLLPKFNETDVDTFFRLFECLADVMKWPVNRLCCYSVC